VVRTQKSILTLQTVIMPEEVPKEMLLELHEILSKDHNIVVYNFGNPNSTHISVDDLSSFLESISDFKTDNFRVIYFNDFKEGSDCIFSEKGSPKCNTCHLADLTKLKKRFNFLNTYVGTLNVNNRKIKWHHSGTELFCYTKKEQIDFDYKIKRVFATYGFTLKTNEGLVLIPTNQTFLPLL